MLQFIFWLQKDSQMGDIGVAENHILVDELEVHGGPPSIWTNIFTCSYLYEIITHQYYYDSTVSYLIPVPINS